MKLKLNLPLFDIAKRYSVSRTTVQNIHMTYLHLLHKVLFKGVLNKILSFEKKSKLLTRCIWGFFKCTEFMIEKPRSDLNAASLLYSNYKHNLSAKYSSAVAPNGAISCQQWLLREHQQ